MKVRLLLVQIPLDRHIGSVMKEKKHVHRTVIHAFKHDYNNTS